MKSMTASLTVLLALSTPLASLAQTNRNMNPNESPTNLPGATTIAAPPADFDPLTASDQDLQYYGFPPRPNQATDTKAYASWVKAMKASKTRVVPVLEQTSIFHGPAQLVKNPTAGENESAVSSSSSNTSYTSNWSGYVDQSGATRYGSSSFYFTVNEMVVPVAEQAYGACTGGWDYGSAWNGIDGWGSGDVLQAGFEFDAYCSIFTKASYYSAWYEWYPYGEVRISSLPVSPGDDIFVEVWHTSSTQGYAYLVNYNTDKAVEVGFTAPSGHALIGNSAEWVVERPTVGGSLATLTNYIADPFWNAYAYTESSVFYDTNGANAVIMLDNSNKPISYPTWFGSESFLMQNEGSSR